MGAGENKLSLSWGSALAELGKKDFLLGVLKQDLLFCFVTKISLYFIQLGLNKALYRNKSPRLPGSGFAWRGNCSCSHCDRGK